MPLQYCSAATVDKLNISESHRDLPEHGEVTPILAEFQSSKNHHCRMRSFHAEDIQL